MLNNFIYAKTKALFEEALNRGDVLNEAIAFIEDTKEIWNHSNYFATQLTAEEVESIINSSDSISNIYDLLNDKQDGIVDLDTIRNGAALGATSVQPDDLESKADKATTLAGYGITDCYINNGTINIASNLITPLIGITNVNSEGLTIANAYTDDSSTHPVKVPYASASQLGVIKVGDNLTVDNNGTLNAPTKVSLFINDVGYLTEHLDISNLATKTELSNIQTTAQEYTNNAVSTLNTFMNFYEGSNKATSVTSLPVTKRLCVVTISASESLSLISTPEAGREVHVIINNSDTSDISIALPDTGSYVCLSDTALTINAGGYAEVNIISDGSKMYIRSL